MEGTSLAFRVMLHCLGFSAVFLFFLSGSLSAILNHQTNRIVGERVNQIEQLEQQHK